MFQREFGRRLPPATTLVIWAVMLLLCQNVVAAPAAPAADFFVSPGGRDSWSGKLAAPNAARTDGPFATLARARDAVRRLKGKSAKKEISVLLRGGTHTLKETLVFTIEDSAPPDGSITYAAYPGEVPVISSGIPVRRWTKLAQAPDNFPAAARKHLWVAELPPGIVRPLTLYDGLDRLPRAQGEGFAPLPLLEKTNPPADKIYFPAGKLRHWSNLADAELRVIPTADYEMSLLPLATVDEAAGFATTAYQASRPIGPVKFFPVSAWVENVPEVLREPGQWIVSSRERKIYYWPENGPPGEQVTIPALTELVRIEGKIDYDGPRDVPVRGLTFRGLVFGPSERYPWQGRTGWSLQHHWDMFDRPTAALRLRGAESCVVERCRFIANSGTAIRLDLHCQENRIVDNEIAHAGGVGILCAGYGPGTKDVNRRNEISNNWIHDIGEINWAAPAIMVWQSGENRIANNLIEHVPYTGIAVSGRVGWNPTNTTSDGTRTVRWREIGNYTNYFGWNERERFLHARKNVVERNEIRHVMEKLGDGNGIYVSGAGGGNRLRQNFIHHNDNDHMGGPIRCDDFQEETVIEGNLIWHNRSVGQGICSKGKNHIINNIIVDMLPSGLVIRPENINRAYLGFIVNPVTGSRVERNLIVALRNDIPVTVQKRIYGMGGEPRLRDCAADFNLYHCMFDPDWGRNHLEREQPFGIERSSLAADPLFVDLAKGDFRLRPESPALKLGFQPIDQTAIGLKPGNPFYPSK